MSNLIEQSEKIRERLFARNLYDFNDSYPGDAGELGEVINVVNKISQIVSPYSGFDLNETAFGRVIGDKTPLTEIGLIMLGKQFMQNSMKKLTTDNVPTIELSNIFLNDEKVFQRKEDYSITKKDDVGYLERFTDFFYKRTSDREFFKDATNLEYIRNTGEAQLSFLFKQLNNNKYVSSVIKDNSDGLIKSRSNTILKPEKIYFNYSWNKYRKFHVDVYEMELFANNEMRKSEIDLFNDNENQDYAPNINFVEENFGKTIKTEKFKSSNLLNKDDERNNWINSDSGFKYEDDESKIVWGRDGISPETEKQIRYFRALSPFDKTIKRNNPKDFNIRTGLLEYTRNLINSTGGQIGDITRKAFTNTDNEIAGFNGSGLWRAPDNALSRFRDKFGIRQHSILDQYDRFVKAIRFDGNHVYNGDVDSVINKSVIPRIHPTLDDGHVNNKNLMFSIENLAVQILDRGETDKKSRYATIDDEFGTKIPKTEVGNFNGRVMWFPPYNLEFNETATANFESTVMVGRNEPVYNYMHSERTGTIRFSLLIDHPPQLKNYRGNNKHKEIAEFFAFGGDRIKEDDVDIDRLEQKKSDIENQITELKNNEKEINVNPPEGKINIYFPNDQPNNNEETVIDYMYKTFNYEIMNGLKAKDSSKGSLNKHIYYGTSAEVYWISKKNPIEYEFNEKLYGDRSQYYREKNENVKIDKYLSDAFNDENNRKFLKIKIVGGASKLYRGDENEEAYNLEVGEKRANAAKFFVKERLKAIFKKDLDIKIETNSIGSEKAEVINACETRITNTATKLERYAEIKIERNNNADTTEVELNENEKEKLDSLEKELSEINSQLNKIRTPETFKERTVGDENSGEGDDGTLLGFNSISKNKFYPAFHSQTPEDFHKRLTFLHQCTRQGKSIRYDSTIDDTGIPRARNSVFGKQPICVLRIGDFFHTKIIIETITLDYDDTIWDTNPEGFGMQPMLANITLNIKIMGGQSLKAPIDALQNAVSFNYYANSTYSKEGTYKTPSNIASKQKKFTEGIDDENNNEE